MNCTAKRILTASLIIASLSSAFVATTYGSIGSALQGIGQDANDNKLGYAAGAVAVATIASIIGTAIARRPGPTMEAGRYIDSAGMSLKQVAKDVGHDIKDEANAFRHTHRTGFWARNGTLVSIVGALTTVALTGAWVASR
ncbi:MAG: hypothetical protein QG604_433 [Candidatus Dependentiae bacterium]|nr:hypothetical protein [Candidatus Dependentiae bacterium]